MLDRVDKDVKKQKLTLWMAVDVVKRIKHRALDQGKTLSKYIADLVTGEAVLQEAIDRLSVELEKFNSMEEAYGLERAVEILKKLREDVQNPSVHF